MAFQANPQHIQRLESRSTPTPTTTRYNETGTDLREFGPRPAHPKILKRMGVPRKASDGPGNTPQVTIAEKGHSHWSSFTAFDG